MLLLRFFSSYVTSTCFVTFVAYESNDIESQIGMPDTDFMQPRGMDINIETSETCFQLHATNWVSGKADGWY